MEKIGLGIFIFFCLVEYIFVQCLTYVSAKMKGETIVKRSDTWNL